MVSQEFTCKCGKQKAWISEEKETSPCPSCGRVYKGKYNKKTLHIEAIEQSRFCFGCKAYHTKDEPCLLPRG